MNILNNPLVSIIIPTFNRQDLILETINSILSQTYTNFELIIVSDCSEDNTREIVTNIKDKRIYFFELPFNTGLPAIVRNYGIRKSKGDFIAFCDDDDIWMPNKLAVQLEVMLRKSVDFCFSDMKIFYGENKELSRVQPKRKLANLFNLGFSNFIFLYNLISNATVILDRNLLLKVGLLNEDPNLRAVEDYEFWIRCLNFAKPHFCNERLILYRIHTNRISDIDEGKSKKRYILNSLFSKNVISSWQLFLGLLT